MRKTKIVCTLGPATNNLAMIEQLYAAGMNVVRLNMSHGDHESHAQAIAHVRELNRRVPHPVAILLDTQGPEIRTGDLVEDLHVRSGDIITVSVRSAENVEETSLQINYADLLDAVDIGDRITVDNGLINLEVLEKMERSMRCRVVDGGTLKSKRHVNLPGVRVNLPALTKKDERDIRFGLEQGVDFIALSFVRDASDIQQLRNLMGEQGQGVRVIAKIEDQEGVRNLEPIIAASDGVMVARGDLGVEIRVEMLPNVQRRIVRLCAEHGRRVIVATHLLESMINNPIPTRAEVTDVANAVYEEVDAVMLSGETTVGKYPVKCVEMLNRIARESEKTPGLRFSDGLFTDNDKQKVARAAVDLAESLRARGIVVFTRRGMMADFVSNCRPRLCPVFAFTDNSDTRSHLALNYSTYAYSVAFHDDPEQTLAEAFATLRTAGQVTSDDVLVIVSDRLTGNKVDGVQVRRLD